MSLLSTLVKFAAEQPRVPPGSPTGGQWLRAQASGFNDKWSRAEIQTVTEYSSFEFQKINERLRSGKHQSDPYVTKNIATLDGLFARAPRLTSDLTVYRRLPASLVKDGMVQDKAFMSVSLHPEGVEWSRGTTGTASDVVVALTVPKGTRVVVPGIRRGYSQDLLEKEHELLLPRGLALHASVDVAKFNATQPRAPAGNPAGGQWVGTGYRVGSLDDPHRRGVHFATTRAGAEAYAVFHPEHTVQEHQLHATNALVVGHQNDVAQTFFGRSYQEMHKKLGGGVEGGRKFDQKVRREALKRGYDAIVYTSPAPPAEGEIAVFHPDVIEITGIQKFNATQPRAPKGSPTGGQWTAQSLPSAAYPIAQAHPETLNRFRRADGTFTPERQRLHDAIINSYFTAATPVKHPETVVIGGGPASGKSTALKAILQRKNFIHVDADDIKQMLPEFAEGVKAKDDTIGTQVHEESALLQKAVVARATAAGYNLIVDGTGDHSYDKLAKKVASYRTPGRKVSAYYTTVDIEEAIRRAHERGKDSGRHVPEEYNREAHRNVSSVFATALQNKLFDEANLFDTNGPAPVKIAEAKGAKVAVLDVPAWQRFLAKAQTNDLAQAPFAFGAPSRIPPHELKNYLAAYGQEWKAAPLPADVERGKMGDCYKNATHAILANPDWRYAEGYAYPSHVPLPVLHGWAVKPDGTVVDPTWTESARYFGVAYDREAYLAHIVKTKMYGVLGGKSKDAEHVIKTGGAHLRHGKKGVLP